MGRRMVGALMDGQTDGRTDTQNFRGYNIIPRHFLVEGHKNLKRVWHLNLFSMTRVKLCMAVNCKHIFSQ